MRDKQICTKILFSNTNNIGGNIVGGLDFITCEQTFRDHSNRAKKIKGNMTDIQEMFLFRFRSVWMDFKIIVFVEINAALQRRIYIGKFWMHVPPPSLSPIFFIFIFGKFSRIKVALLWEVQNPSLNYIVNFVNWNWCDSRGLCTHFYNRRCWCQR